MPRLFSHARRVVYLGPTSPGSVHDKTLADESGLALRAPVAEKLLRAPGESLRRKLEKLDEQISEKLAVAYVLPLMVTSTVLLQPYRTLLGPAVIGGALIGVPAFIYLCRRLVSLLDQRRRYRLGLSGERAVGEELNLLMLAG